VPDEFDINSRKHVPALHCLKAKPQVGEIEKCHKVTFTLAISWYLKG